MYDPEEVDANPDPDAYLYGSFDATRGLPPDPTEYGFFDEDAEAYMLAYNSATLNKE